MTLQDKKARMAAIVADWQASGMSQLEYAKLHNFKIGTLRYWVARQRRIREKSGAFIQLSAKSVQPGASQQIHIRYPHGIELMLPSHTPVQVIRALIRQ